MGICRKGWRYTSLPLAIWLVCGTSQLALAQAGNNAPDGAQPPDLRGAQAEGAPVAAPSANGGNTTLARPTSTNTKNRPAQPRANYTGSLDLSGQQNDQRAPSWLFVPRVQLTEIGTDNVDPQLATKTADLMSRLSVGGQLGVDTPRLTSYSNFDASYSKYARTSRFDHFSGSLFDTTHATFVPDYLFMDVHANITELARDQTPVLNNALLNGQNDLQTYTITTSPYTEFQLGRLASAELRYIGSWAWFSTQQNAAPVGLPPALTSPVSDYSQHQLHGELAAAGTISERLMSDISVDGQYSDTGAIGIYRHNTALWINEYQFTRSFSLIGSGGYEQAFDKKVTLFRIDEAIGSGGFRYRPNADSSILLTYGRYDGATDFAGEAMFRLTPFTAVYAAYTDSITTSQQSLISNNATFQHSGIRSLEFT